MPEMRQRTLQKYNWAVGRSFTLDLWQIGLWSEVLSTALSESLDDGVGSRGKMIAFGSSAGDQTSRGEVQAQTGRGSLGERNRNQVYVP